MMEARLRLFAVRNYVPPNLIQVQHMSTDVIVQQHISIEDVRWEALSRRDKSADGTFWYGVATTGVYCRPGCSSRLPKRTNVRFFDRPADAERAGFRACKRCKPDELQVEPLHIKVIIRACALLDAAEHPMSLRELADAAKLSPSHFHRLFKATTGVTPKQYASAKRIHRVQERLHQDPTITEAMYNAGFGSSSRFYAASMTALGMKPSAYRNGAKGVTIRFAVEKCYLGWVLIGATSRGICTIEFGDTADALIQQLHTRFPFAELIGNDSTFDAWVTQVLTFIEAPQRGFHLPLDVKGTAFQRRVWTALQNIPVGTKISYKEIAALIGRPKAVRAVAQACASNPVAVAIPCHRVVASNGSLNGYRWGVARKRAMLEHEANETNECSAPDLVP
jgi:AraC family transcriptional regulator, regulatory protein of adaptative response / methylated-DNA-[protein]-cysteine methyltransferase